MNKLEEAARDRRNDVEQKLESCIDVRMMSGDVVSDLIEVRKLFAIFFHEQNTLTLHGKMKELKNALKNSLEGLFDELQAEKQKVKERDEFIKKVSETHPDSNPIILIKEARELLNQ